jgi:hypothetical protein
MFWWPLVGKAFGELSGLSGLATQAPSVGYGADQFHDGGDQFIHSAQLF